jgi:hypothetical protein
MSYTKIYLKIGCARGSESENLPDAHVVIINLALWRREAASKGAPEGAEAGFPSSVVRFRLSFEALCLMAKGASG